MFASDLISGYRAMIAQAHAAGVRIVGGTLLPYRGAAYYSAAGEAVREQANAWVRGAGAFDGSIDFGKALADPTDPLTLAPGDDCGDHMHPNDAGARVLADAVDLPEIDGSS